MRATNTPWQRFLAYVELSDTTPSEFFSLTVRLTWGLMMLLDPFLPGHFSRLEAYTTQPVSFGFVGYWGAATYLALSGMLHAYSILWEHPRLRRLILLTVVPWWVLLAVSTLLLQGFNISVVSYLMLGMWMSWAYWRRSPSSVEV